MESLLVPFRSSRKLSSRNDFTSKNAYDGLFSGQKKFGSAPTDDYREIFGNSQGVSSIPVLDLSGLDDPTGSSNLRSSKPDYSNIFGGFRDDDDGAVSYEELLRRVNGVTNSPEKARTTSARRQPSEDLEDLFDTSNESADALKKYNMSYHKTTQKSKDGSNGTTHVAQLHDVPGFTCFIDEIKMASSLKAEAETQKSSTVNGIHPKSGGGPEVKKSKGQEQTAGHAAKSKSRYDRGGSFSDDKLFNAYEINVKSHPSKLPSPSSMPPPYSENHQACSNGPVASNSGAPEIDSDEDLDVNSAAAASVAALKKAIEKAQESIRIAKESVGRRNEGLRSFSNKSFKDSLKVKGLEATDMKVDGKYGRVAAASEVFDLMESKIMRPEFKDGEKLFVARKVIDEMHGKISESARQHERSTWSTPELTENERVPVSREVRDETTGRNRESNVRLEASTRSSEQVTVEKGTTTISEFEPPFGGNNILESADYHESKLEDRTINETLGEQGFVKKLDVVEKSCEAEDMGRKHNTEVRVHGIESASLADEEIGGNNILESADYHESKLEDRTINETLGEQGFVKKLDLVEKSCEAEDTGRKHNTEVRVHGIESASLVDEERENGLAGSKQEEREVLEKPHGFFKLVNFVKNFRGFVETVEDDKKVSNKLKDHNDYKVRVNEAHNFFQDENKLNDSREMTENEQKDRDNEKRLDQASEQFEVGKEQEEVLEENIEKIENESELQNTCDHDVNEKILEEVSQWVENEPKESDVSNESEKEDTHKEQAIETWLDEVHELEINEKAQAFVHGMEESEIGLEDEFKIKQDDNQKGEETKKFSEERDANDEKDSEVTFKETTASGTDGNEETREIEMSQKVDYEEIFARDFDGLNHDTSSIAVETQDTCKVEVDDNKGEAGQEANDGDRRLQVTEEEAEVVEGLNRVQEDDNFEAAGRTSTEDDEREFEVREVHEAFSFNEGNYGLADKEEVTIGQTARQSDVTADGTETVSNETVETEKHIKEEVKIDFSREERKLFPKRAHWDLERSRLPSIPIEKEQTVEIKDELKRSQYRGKSENLSRTMEDKKDEVKKVEEKKQLKDLDEETKRQREREKDRMVVERAIREARERAFAEARERAERAAVERATAEVRQRVLAEAREKIERVSSGTTTTTKSSSEKASAEAKIRAERAAVERATAEARERALEKAMSQKTTTSERVVAEKFSGASRDSGIRQSSSADLHGSSGSNSELAQRSKARLERHNRIMERAAKALAEKENRDLLAQREQAERNRFAETLDAEIKRWSSGKQGNLRALLSTLQYILGSNSGWQPVTLTEIITTSAVKKAYRKATLVVHPDKVQQRGASIQQKYICEKVFDLLKAAWNKFNSEER